MVSVHMLPAGRGDFFIIEYGTGSEEHSVFIDGGDKSGALFYKKILSDYCTQNKIIDALIFTHIDDDHIAGALTAMSSMQQLPEIKKIYLNTGKNAADRLAVPVGSELPELKERDYLHTAHKQHTVKKALSLMEMLEEKGLADRIAKAVCLGDRLSIGGADLKIISPGEKQLENYLKYWKEEEKRIEEKKRSEKQHAAILREPMKALSTYASEAVREDNSPSNGSSIAFLFEYEGKKMAFLGDAHPSVCAEGILKFYPDGTCADFVKVPHHGSRHNYSEQMYQLLGTSDFLLSTNGRAQGRAQHPDPVFLGKLFCRFPKARIYCNFNWMKSYGFTDEDKEQYLNTKDPQIIYVKDDVLLPSGLIIRGAYGR